MLSIYFKTQKYIKGFIAPFLLLGGDKGGKGEWMDG